MNEMMHNNEAPEGGAGDSEAEQTAAERGRLVEDLRQLGRLLGDTMRAAASTPEAENLKKELKEGISAMRTEIDATVETTRETTARVSREYKPSGTGRLRTDLAAALRALNRALDGLASTVEPGPTGAGTTSPAAPSAGAGETGDDMESPGTHVE
jgi:hypothetical protein